MLKLIKNELIKIFKRKNIYLLLIIGIILIISYNLFQKLTTSNIDINHQYQSAYNNDKFFLENYNELNLKDNYEDIVERIKLEEYAIENNIQYNILLNSENSNVPLMTDARILLMRVFYNFDIIVIFIIIYLSSTIISEEYNNGTIKNLLTKPHTRKKILLSKIVTSVFITIIVLVFIVLSQYLLGGFLFGFDSYTLDAIRYNRVTQAIEITNLVNYMIIIILSKIPMYLLLTIISLLFSVVTNNIALNILISLGLYIISTIEILINNISKYLFMYNWDISKYLFISDISIKQPIVISSMSLFLIFALLVIGFKNKDIKNE